MSDLRWRFWLCHYSKTRLKHLSWFLGIGYRRPTVDFTSFILWVNQQRLQLCTQSIYPRCNGYPCYLWCGALVPLWCKSRNRTLLVSEFSCLTGSHSLLIDRIVRNRLWTLLESDYEASLPQKLFFFGCPCLRYSSYSNFKHWRWLLQSLVYLGRHQPLHSLSLHLGHSNASSKGQRASSEATTNFVRPSLLNDWISNYQCYLISLRTGYATLYYYYNSKRFLDSHTREEADTIASPCREAERSFVLWEPLTCNQSTP